MQGKERKYFGGNDGAGNFDDADFIVGPNQWVNMENARVGSTDKGVIGTVEGIGSTVLKSTSEPSVTNVVIGNVEDIANNRIIYFVKDLYGPWDKIMCFYVGTETFYTVLLSSQVDSGLNFNKNYLIHSCKVVDNMLYWTDNLNQPRKINIDSGIKLNHPSFSTTEVAYVAPLSGKEITIIKPPPPLSPNIIKYYDGDFENNFIANDSFSFAFQYIYYDNEETVVGTYSVSSRLNRVDDIFNSILVTMDINETIPQTVRIVNLIVRIGGNVNPEGDSAFVIKTWDKDIASELTDIDNQNNGSQQLSFAFFNNITGQAIAKDLILKPFDSVPITSKTLEVAKDRLFLGNNIEGYDTPIGTSLTFELTTIPIAAASSVTKNLISVRMRQNVSIIPGLYYTSWYVYLTEISPIGYYAINSTEVSCNPCLSYPALPAAPSSVAVSGLTFRGATILDVKASIEATYSVTIQQYGSLTSATTIEVTGVSVTTYDIFKTQSQYKLGIVFYDFAMRKCGVVTPPFNLSVQDPTLVNIPARDFDMTEAIGGIVWSLSNLNSIVEIPDWAYYYTIVRTLNLRTRYFLQAFQQTSNAKYATKDADGNYEFTSTSFVTGAVGIALDTTSLVQAGLGYSFTEGDVCFLIKDNGDTYTLSVIGQSGKYVLVNTPEGGIGNFASFQMIYELYTPYQTSAQEPYYEVGEMYRILNPGTIDRQYETLTATLGPDAYVLTRNYDSETYYAETMSPNDRFFGRWDNDAGKVNLVTKQGQRLKKVNISFSNTFIPGTATNGLSTFEALNESDLPIENGEIQKLVLTSKTQDQGSVMLGVCTNETTSIYLGETQILDNTGATQFFASSSGVIGTKNNLKGSFGTINPESVVEFRGNVYWVDVNNGKVIQYSANGLFPISEYKMTRFWKLFCKTYLSTPTETIESYGMRPFIFSAVDPSHWELLITVPQVLPEPPKGNVPDYGFAYPFDIWDGKGKTLVYKLNKEPNFWQGCYKVIPENWATIQNKLFSFKFGQLYEHNSTQSYNILYGVQAKPRIMFVCNQIPNRPKVYNNISVDGNSAPTLTYFMVEEPYIQTSDLADFDYRNLEGILYSIIYRNKLVPTATGFQTTGLLTGDKMRGKVFKVYLEFTITNQPLELRFVEIGFALSAGHTTT